MTDAADATFPDPSTRNALEPDCERCPALVECRTRISWGNGARDADVVIVGEAPGAGDPAAERWRGGNHTGMAYTTRHSGRLVRRLFADAGYGPGEVYLTNAVKCFPCDGAGSNREPTPEEREACFAHLRTELDAVDPAVVAATGKHATTALLEHEGRAVGSFLDRVLDPVECPGLGVTVLPLLHPSYQNVWLSRLGYDREGYVRNLGATLDGLVED